MGSDTSSPSAPRTSNRNRFRRNKTSHKSTSIMTRACLGLLLLAAVFQQWHSPLLPLRAARSPRGGAAGATGSTDAAVNSETYETAESNAADESRRRTRGRFVGIATGSTYADSAVDAEYEPTEENGFDRPRRQTESQARSLASNDGTGNFAIGQLHRGERYAWSNDPPEEEEEGEEEEEYGGDEDDGNEGEEDAAATRLFPFEHRIIGGRASAGNSSSFTVSLQDRFGNHFCGGSLVSKDCVLTAAHCASRVTGRGPITAVIGRRTLSDADGEELKVKMEKIHPRYDVRKANVEWNYDFALLVLERPTMTRAKIIELNDDPLLPQGGSLVSVTGWGDTDPSAAVHEPADTLQKASLRIVGNNECGKVTGSFGEYSVSYHGYVRDDMMCARNKKRDSCQGDSGGPLTFRGKQVGITSWGVGCNSRKFPGVYARVSSAYPWIKRVICRRSMYPDKRLNCEPW